MTSTQLSKAFRVVIVAFATCACALAQYGGGGTGGTGGPGGTTYTPGSKSYGHGALIGGIVGGAAGAGALFLIVHHRHGAVVGCVAPDGKTLTADSSKRTYQLTGASVTAGEHVSVAGKKSKGPSGLDELEVTAIKKDLGQCESSRASLDTKP